MMPQHIALFVSHAPSLLNFRGPLIRALRNRGITVSALAPNFDEETIAGLSALGVACHQTPLSRRGLNPIEDLKSLRQLTRILRDIQPDLLLTFTIKPNIWGAFAARRANIPSIANITGLGYSFSAETGSLSSRIIRFLGRRLYARSSRINIRVIFQNPDDQNDFIAAGCLKSKAKTRLVNGSGVDLAHYARTPLPSGPAFLMISRLLGEKGVREYAEASLRLMARHPDVSCRLVGFMDDGMDGVTKQEIDRWTAGGLEYRGPQKDVRPEIAASSVYVLPSFYREGTPRSVLEAMAMGRAVLTTDAPGCRETVEDGVTGYLVKPKDVESLFIRMEELAQSADLRRDMGEAGYDLVRRKFDVDVVNQQIFDHISEAMEETS
ncbi:MAG: glycosyltransferase family 4 protein [Tsuneonella suprasediminis]|nr:glycosyltransferase family 4 protein [Altererythrobacter sp. N1]